MTNSKPNLNGRARRQRRGGFTLIELIIVLALLTISAAITYPTLKNFFHGRSIDSEARRLLALTRYAQSRAVSEGVPMELWIDAANKVYGLRAQSGFVADDSKAVAYALQSDLELQVSAPPAITQSGQQNNGIVNTGASPLGGVAQLIRFYPDGFIGDKSPEQVLIRRDETDAIAIAQSASHLNYEIRSIPTR